MNITKNQIKALIDEKGNARKCPECIGKGIWKGETRGHQSYTCFKCQGSGKATITIPKEWVKCPNCVKGIIRKYQSLAYGKKCLLCNSKGNLPKYRVNEEIEVRVTEVTNLKGESRFDDIQVDEYPLKLKIISETEKEWKVCLG